MDTIPHLVRMRDFPLTEKVLAVDIAPLSGEKLMRLGIGTMAELSDRTKQLLKTKIVDRVVDVNYDPDYRDHVYTKHFGSPIWQTHK